MLVVHNLANAGEQTQVITASPFRKFAFGSLLAYADEVARRVGAERMLESHSLLLPGGVAVYGTEQVEPIEATHKYDSIVCHLVLDHGGVVHEDFFAALRGKFLKPDGILINPVQSITKNDVARASRFDLETDSPPCVIKKNNNYNTPATVFEINTQAELDAWRSQTPPEDQPQYVMHKLLRYFDIERLGMYQLERWIVLFDDLTVNFRCSNEFFVKRATSLSYYARDERSLQGDLTRLGNSGYDWRGASIDCAYQSDPEAWDARYEVLKNFRDVFRFDYAELDVLQPAKGEFVVIDVNHTPGPPYKNTHWRELAVRVLAQRLASRGASAAQAGDGPQSASAQSLSEQGALAPEPAPAPPEIGMIGSQSRLEDEPSAAATAPLSEESRRPGAPRPRTNICLCMIVKNETAVLPRLFRSIKDYIDYYVIVDTGSTDDTIGLIRREMGAYGIEGEIHERPWVNFGFNRNQSLELAVAAGKTEWLLFIDADEELGVSDPKFYERLEPGVSYDLEKHHSGTRYAVPHLVNIKSSKFRWEGVVHNYLVTVEGSKRRVVRKDAWIIYHPGEGAKSRGLTSEQKYLRDAKLLEEDLRKNPNNPRSQFYLGQSYRDAGHKDKAYAAYKKRVQMKGGWVEETYVAQLEVGRMALALDKPEEVIVREYLQAFNLRPTRVEPLHDLARYFRLKGQHGKAYIFARTGVEIERPDDQLFISQGVYDWRMLDELGVAAYWVGDYASSKEACETILARVQGGRLSVPDDDLRRIRDNLVHTLKKLGA